MRGQFSEFGEAHTPEFREQSTGMRRHCMQRAVPGTRMHLSSRCPRVSLPQLATLSSNSRHSHLQPLADRSAADRALGTLGRAIGASGLVAARHRGVRLGVDHTDDARRLTAYGRLRWPAGVKLRGTGGSERHHGQRRRIHRYRRSRRGRRCGSISIG
eukprot:scaffold84154_cov69-Phaeocystis_antarctica.AAC.5